MFTDINWRLAFSWAIGAVGVVVGLRLLVVDWWERINTAPQGPRDPNLPFLKIERK